MSVLKSSKDHLKKYLKTLYEGEIRLKKISRIGVADVTEDFKGFGYGAPYLIEFERDDQDYRLVLNTMRGDEFSHEFPWDRAHSLLMAYSNFSKIPRHVKSVDVGAFMSDGSLNSLRESKEFFLLTDFVEGTEYWKDLDKIGIRGDLSQQDVERCSALSRYLAEIHSKKFNAPNLYRRKIRELIGHGECIMGLIDSYPESLNLISQRDFQSIEHKCLDWRWKLKERHHRLSQVHGDYHPWNILFRGETEFTVLDRSRGEWGEPADDVAAMAINYIFFSLRYYGELKNPFKILIEKFLDTYTRACGDEEVLEVIQPFYAWRAIVLASPVWYPNLSGDIRKKLIRFVSEELDLPKVGVAEISSLL